MHGWDEKPCSNYWTTKKNKAALSTSTWSHFGRCNARSRRQPRVTKKVQQSNRNVGLTPTAIVKKRSRPRRELNGGNVNKAVVNIKTPRQ